MFRCFHQNKFLGNQKGQLIPIFIVIMVVLVIMALITVNLSKVSFIKTDTANGADAGALASGAAMANLFNTIAISNVELEKAYWEFYTGVSISYIYATYLLVAAHLKTIAAEGKATIAAGPTCGAFAQTQGVAALAAACPTPCIAAGLALDAEVAALAASGLMGAGAIVLGVAAGEMSDFTYTIWAIIIAVAAFTAAQEYAYKQLRKTADDYHSNAVKMGHRFNFYNSGTSSKLKAGEPPDDLKELITKSADEKTTKNRYLCGYSNLYSAFVAGPKKDASAEEDEEAIGLSPAGGEIFARKFKWSDGKYINQLNDKKAYAYEWLDGPWQDSRGRMHYVVSESDIDNVNDFELKVAVLPWAVEEALLFLTKSLAIAAITNLGILAGSYTCNAAIYASAATDYQVAGVDLAAACDCQLTWIDCDACLPWCAACAAAAAACWAATCASAEGLLGSANGLNAWALADNAICLGDTGTMIGELATIYYPLGGSWAGLLPGPVIKDTKNDVAPLFTICWIDDIDHNRIVKTINTQHHEGGEFGPILGKSTYPDMQSYSIADFSGKGKIHADPWFDTSLIETDNSGKKYDSCPMIKSRAALLEKRIEVLPGQADAMDAQADQYDELAKNLADAADTQDQNTATALQNQQAGQNSGQGQNSGGNSGAANNAVADSSKKMSDDVRKQVQELNDSAVQARADAQMLRDTVTASQQELQDLKDNNPDCLGGEEEEAGNV